MPRIGLSKQTQKKMTEAKKHLSRKTTATNDEVQSALVKKFKTGLSKTLMAQVRKDMKSNGHKGTAAVMRLQHGPRELVEESSTQDLLPMPALLRALQNQMQKANMSRLVFDSESGKAVFTVIHTEKVEMSAD